MPAQPPPMPAQPPLAKAPPAQAPPVKTPPVKAPPVKARQRPRARISGYLPRAILNTIMTLAVIVLERRIRKALRSSG